MDELDYHLPPELIATRPAEPRDAARLLVMWRSNERLEHRQVRDLPQYVRAGDVLVLNTTAVAPARLVGRRISADHRACGRVEGLFLGESSPGEWRVLLKGRGRLRPGQSIELLDRTDRSAGVTLELTGRADEQWIATLRGATTAEALERAGRTPLPPYILRARGTEPLDDALDRNWYQTTYANFMQRHSVAAPTAGLHFTPELLAAIERRGVKRAEVMLHVGPGTFKPVTAPSLEEHRMHSEKFRVPARTVELLREIARARTAGASEPLPAGDRPRVVAVGTTSVRALESLPADLPLLASRSDDVVGKTDLLIAPPYRFKHVHAMLTNFHLPRSTLLALVAAMVGLDRIKAAYELAIEHRYRFYSYGDAMLILP